MLPAQPGRQRAVPGIGFSCDGRVLAKAGASMHIRLHNFESVLSAGTKCVPPLITKRIIMPELLCPTIVGLSLCVGCYTHV